MNNTSTKLQAYGKYKQSGVEWLGEIPEHWDVKKLKYIFQILKRISGELGYEVLSITQTGIKIKDINSGEGQLSMDYSKYQLVFEGDFAMNHMDLLTGYVDVSKYNGVISPDYRVFNILNSNNYKDYLLLLLQLCYKNKVFYAHGQGVSMLGRWRFPADNFNNFSFPIPPLSEQITIAKFIDVKTTKIDQAIAIKQQEINLLKERRQILIQKAVTQGVNPDVKLKDSGIDWIGEIPEHWNIVNFRYLINILTDYTANGSFGDLAKFVNYLDVPSYSRLIRLTDLRKNLNDKGVYLNEKSHKYLSKSELFGGELLIANVGAYAGLAWIMPKISRPASLAPNMFLIKPLENKTLIPYLCNLINSNSYSKYMSIIAQSAAQPKLNKDNIRQLKIILPPIDEQLNIIENIKNFSLKIDSVMSIKEQEIEKLKEYKSSLIDGVLTGKVKVI